MNLATEMDIERLRQAALLLEQENARLFRRPERLAAEPRAYLGERAMRAIRDPGAVTLPRDLKQSRQTRGAPSAMPPEESETYR